MLTLRAGSACSGTGGTGGNVTIRAGTGSSDWKQIYAWDTGKYLVNGWVRGGCAELFIRVASCNAVLLARMTDDGDIKVVLSDDVHDVDQYKECIEEFKQLWMVMRTMDE